MALHYSKQSLKSMFIATPLRLDELLSFTMFMWCVFSKRRLVGEAVNSGTVNGHLRLSPG